MPDLLQMGVAPALLFFDKLVVPDARYVRAALREIDQPEILRSTWDPSGEKTVAEVRLGVGYHLWPDGRPDEDWTRAPRALLRDLEYLASENCLATVDEPAGASLGRRGSFGAADRLARLDDERIQVALQTRLLDLVDVCLVRHRPDHVALASVPKELDRTNVLRLLLKNLPVPLRSVPVSEVLAFKRDRSVAADLTEFRVWMNKALAQHKSLASLEDEYRALYDRYARSIKRLCTEYRSSTLGLLGTVAADVVDNLTQLKAGSAIKALLDWRSTALRVEEKRETAAGREVAYMRRIEEAFSGAKASG